MLTAVGTFFAGNSKRIMFIVGFALIATIFILSRINVSIMKDKVEAETKAETLNVQITDLKGKIEKERRVAREAVTAMERIEDKYRDLIAMLEDLPREDNGDLTDGSVLIILCEAGLMERGQCIDKPDSGQVSGVSGTSSGEGSDKGKPDSGHSGW